jgi:hypothetical protein
MTTLAAKLAHYPFVAVRLDADGRVLGDVPA